MQKLYYDLNQEDRERLNYLYRDWMTGEELRNSSYPDTEITEEEFRERDVLANIRASIIRAGLSVLSANYEPHPQHNLRIDQENFKRLYEHKLPKEEYQKLFSFYTIYIEKCFLILEQNRGVEVASLKRKHLKEYEIRLRRETAYLRRQATKVKKSQGNVLF